jgi:putative PIN family toxin of toxin-antitoxin system
MKVVFDTNIFISAFIVPGSQGEQAFSHARQGCFELYTSVPILTETANKLRKKFDQPEADITETLKIISRAAEVLKPPISLTVLNDTPDNRILECALEADADLVVTGDRHLLKLKKFHDIPIIRLADFLRMFPEENR